MSPSLKPPPLADKGRSVEEWLDLHFFRPIGIRIARAVYSTRVSPDQVTVWSLAVGLVAGHLFVYGDPWTDVAGFALFIVSEIFDSADGQLARLRGTATRMGRTLDGISDNLRFTNLYLHLMYRLIQGGMWWPGAALLVVAAGLAHAYQSAAVDFIRQAFLYVTVAARSELDLPDDLEIVSHYTREGTPANSFGTRLRRTHFVRHSPVLSASARASWSTLLERFSTRLYQAYVLRQSQLFPRSVRLIRSLRNGAVTDELRAEYRYRQGLLLPLCAVLGQNTRFLVLGAAALDRYVAAFLWAEAVPMSLLLLLLLLRHEANATVLDGIRRREPVLVSSS